MENPVVFFCGKTAQFGVRSAVEMKTREQIAIEELSKPLQKKDQQRSVSHWPFLHLLKARECIMVQCSEFTGAV